MKRFISTLIVAAMLATVATNASAQTGVASWYQEGRLTANGERFNPNLLTAAHKTLPFGTIVKVVYKGKSVTVRINDRGPFIKGRVLDLSRAAARQINCKGVCKVEYFIIKMGNGKTYHKQHKRRHKHA